LMDETLVAFGALWVHRQAGGDAARAVAITITACSVGEIVGLALVDRLVERAGPRRVLALSCVGCTLALGGWLASGSLVTNVASLFFVGVLAAPQYPIAKAQAYRAAPGRGAVVNAIGQAFTVLDLVIPIALGAVADSAGLAAALALILV